MSKENKQEQTTAITVANEKIGNFLTSIKGNLHKYAIRSYEQQQFMNSVILAIEEDGNLQKCLNTKEGQISMYNALKRAASTGLSLNPQESKAVLIPRKGKVTYQIMKDGLIDLALESGIKKIRADIVRAGDTFSIAARMSGDFYEHQIALIDRGDIIGFYAALITDDGTGYVKYMSTGEVQEHAERYSMHYDQDLKKKVYNALVNNHPQAYGLKTVIKTLLRSVRLSQDTASAIRADEEPLKPSITVEVSSSEKGHSGDRVAQELEQKTQKEEQAAAAEEKAEEVPEPEETDFIY